MSEREDDGKQAAQDVKDVVAASESEARKVMEAAKRCLSDERMRPFVIRQSLAGMKAATPGFLQGLLTGLLIAKGDLPEEEILRTYNSVALMAAMSMAALGDAVEEEGSKGTDGWTYSIDDKEGGERSCSPSPAAP